jgi:hypothetical protein
VPSSVDRDLADSGDVLGIGLGERARHRVVLLPGVAAHDVQRRCASWTTLPSAYDHGEVELKRRRDHYGVAGDDVRNGGFGDAQRSSNRTRWPTGPPCSGKAIRPAATAQRATSTRNRPARTAGSCSARRRASVASTV